MRRLSALFAALALAASASAQEASKNLIVYFSLQGNQRTLQTDAVSGASLVVRDGKPVGSTEAIAQMIQEEVGGDIVLIETENRFSDDHKTVLEEARHNKNTRHKATKTRVDTAQYDTVFIGFPAWWYDMPDPVFDFLDKHDLGGKKVFVFCTHGGSGLMRSISEIQSAQPNASVGKTGFAVWGKDAAGAKDDVRDWLRRLGLR